MADLNTPYTPVAVILPDADRMEYVTRDCAMVAEIIDGNLCILRDMKTNEIVGVAIENWSQIAR